MPRVDADFKDKVYNIVKNIPKGKVMSYGQVAAIAGTPIAAWEVGQLAHTGPNDLPWQRVVSKDGRLANAYTWGGLEGHKSLLEQDGIEVLDNYQIDMNKYQVK